MKRKRSPTLELALLFGAIVRDAADYFALGAMRCRKTLSNGAVATVSIRMPSEKPRGR